VRHPCAVQRLERCRAELLAQPPEPIDVQHGELCELAPLDRDARGKVPAATVTRNRDCRSVKPSGSSACTRSSNVIGATRGCADRSECRRCGLIRRASGRRRPPDTW
jgi:hypothetical protein